MFWIIDNVYIKNLTTWFWLEQILRQLSLFYLLLFIFRIIDNERLIIQNLCIISIWSFQTILKSKTKNLDAFQSKKEIEPIFQKISKRTNRKEKIARWDLNLWPPGKISDTEPLELTQLDWRLRSQHSHFVLFWWHTSSWVQTPD